VAYLCLVRRVVRPIFAILFVLAFSGVALPAEPDPRFEGVWVGVETFQVPANLAQKGDTFSKATTLAIGESGKILGILDGPFRGRYTVSEQASGGNTLVFFGGHRASTLLLSRDGNTLTEKGNAHLAAIRGNSNTFVSSTVTATFHRQGKK
jgi:hypothetical protein